MLCTSSLYFSYSTTLIILPWIKTYSRYLFLMRHDQFLAPCSSLWPREIKWFQCFHQLILLSFHKISRTTWLFISFLIATQWSTRWFRPTLTHISRCWLATFLVWICYSFSLNFIVARVIHWLDLWGLKHVSFCPWARFNFFNAWW